MMQDNENDALRNRITANEQMISANLNKLNTNKAELSNYKYKVNANENAIND